MTGGGLANELVKRGGKGALSLLKGAKGAVAGFRVGNQVVQEVAVIGRRQAALYHVGRDGVEVFTMAGRYRIEKNMEWIDGLIKRRVVFELASPINEKTLYDEFGGLTIFGQEVRRLEAAGYRQWDNYMLPPR